MLEAFLFGILAASSLLVGVVIALQFKLSRRTLGGIMAFGVGVLISAVAFELTEEAFLQSNNILVLVFGLIAGAVSFFVGDKLIDKFGGNHRKRSDREGYSSAKAITLGTILDSIPESIVLGLGIFLSGSISLAVFVAIFISNIPEAIGSTGGMMKNGWRNSSLFYMWFSVVLMSGVASMVGFAIFRFASVEVVAFTLTFAGGALLTMLSDTMMPEAYKDTGSWAGILTTFGFGLAFWLSLLA